MRSMRGGVDFVPTLLFVRRANGRNHGTSRQSRGDMDWRREYSTHSDDPQIPNDRLILGMKGIISEMELYTMRTRLERGRLNKALRGEMFQGVPAGYAKNGAGVVEKDPDETRCQQWKIPAACPE